MPSTAVASSAASQEQVLESREFTTNLALFWLKTHFELTTKRVRGNAPNTFLGIVPLGKYEITFPLRNVAGVSSSTKFYFKRFVVGVVLILIGLSFVGDSLFIGLLLLLVGAIAVLNCYVSRFTITNNAGQSPTVDLSILEKEKVRRFVAEVNEQVAHA